MINHVVLFKLKDYPVEEKKKVLAEVKDALEGLKDKIKEVKYIEVGLNYEVEAKSHDICLISHFESIADLDVYRVHPDHMKVVDLIGKVAETRAAVDYEF